MWCGISCYNPLEKLRGMTKAFAWKDGVNPQTLCFDYLFLYSKNFKILWIKITICYFSHFCWVLGAQLGCSEESDQTSYMAADFQQGMSQPGQTEAADLLMLLPRSCISVLPSNSQSAQVTRPTPIQREEK